jgi:hypothetical protein
MIDTKRQEHDDFVAGGDDRFDGFDRGDLDRDHEADQNAMNEAEAADERRARRIADRIDGYDRDDIGESPDY